MPAASRGRKLSLPLFSPMQMEQRTFSTRASRSTGSRLQQQRQEEGAVKQKGEMR